MFDRDYWTGTRTLEPKTANILDPVYVGIMIKTDAGTMTMLESWLNLQQIHCYHKAQFGKRFTAIGILDFNGRNSRYWSLNRKPIETIVPHIVDFQNGNAMILKPLVTKLVTIVNGTKLKLATNTSLTLLSTMALLSPTKPFIV